MKRHLLLFALLLLISGVMFGQEQFTITVLSNNEAWGAVTGGGLFPADTTITISASPISGYKFDYWKKGDIQVSTNANYNFEVTENATYTAYFSEIPATNYTITVLSNNEAWGAVTGGGLFPADTTITISASPISGYKFDYWKKGDIQVSTNANYSFEVTENATYTAYFSEIPAYTISVSANPTSGGEPYIGSTPGTTQATFTHGQPCTVHANPANGYTFSKWMENGNQVSTLVDYSFSVTSNRNLVAHFTQNTYLITLRANPEEGGRVEGGGSFYYNDTPSLSAIPNSNYEFVGWNDGNTDNPRTIRVISDSTFTASFGEVGTTYYHVTCTVYPENAGYVTGTGNFPANTTIQLQAIPYNGYNFDHWQDGDNHNPRIVMVDGDMEFTACFNRVPYTISVSANPTNGGMVHVGNTNLQQGTYYYGQFCTVYANPSTGYTFTNWTENGNVVWEYANYHFQVTDNRNLVANFTQAGSTEYTITTNVSPAGSGIVNGSGTYPSGTQATLEAIPNDGYTFDHWNDGSTENPHTITVTGNATYTAYFTQAGSTEYTITTNVSPAGSGTVTGGGNSFHYGDQTTLTANPNSGYTFDHWNDGSTQNPRTITVTGDATYTATFKQDSYTITVKANNDEWGTVTGGGEFNYGQTTTLRARANEGYEFEGWNDGNPDNPRQITVTCDSTFIAIFDVEGSNYYNVTTAVTPIGAGRVTGGGTYPENTDISLNAIANIGYTFSHWQDGNTNNPRSFTVNESLSFTAHFTTNTYTINVVANPEEGGVVTGDGPYAYGVDCTLKARSKPGYTFINWTENNIVVSTNDTYTFTVECDRNLIANFTSEQQYTITVSANPEEGGTVNGGGSYAYDVTCTLKAIPNTGYTFTNWTENGTAVSSNSTYEFTVTTDRNLIANFEKDESLCIEDPKNIEPKYHTDNDGHKYILLLVYPKHNDIYTYQWSYARPNSNSDSLIYNPIGIDQPYYYEEGGLSDGFYKVSITKKGEGCSPYVAEYPVTGNKNNNKLRIYPNPSRRDHNIVVVNDSNGPSQLSIYSTDGRPLHAQTVTDNQTTLNLNLPSGVYIVYLTDSDGYTKIGKLVIQ